MNKDFKLEVGDVVQINPDSQLGDKQGFLAACLMIVTELKAFGAQGYVAVPSGPRGESPGLAFARVNFEDMGYVGKAQWIRE